MAKQKPGRIELYVIDKVRTMREEKEWTQKELAEKLNVGFAFIGDVESPKRPQKYNLKHINKLAEIFKCSPKDFLPDKPL